MAESALDTGRMIPKSACIGCPFHDDRFWNDLRVNSPDEFADAVAVDNAIRDGGTMRGMESKQYTHRSRQPLQDVDFTWWQQQQSFGFLEECEGMCGV